MGNRISSKIHEYVEKKEDEYLDRLRSAALMMTMNKSEAQENAKNKYLMDIDRNSVSFIMLAREAASSSNADHPKSTNCNRYKPKAEIETIRFPGIPLSFLKHDEDSLTDSFSTFNTIFGALNELAMVEKKPIYFDRPEDVRVTINAGFGNDSLPFQTVFWHYWNSHKTIRNLAFSGIASYYLSGVTNAGTGHTPTDAFYQVDLSRWYEYSVRRVHDIQSEENDVKIKDISNLIQQKKHKSKPVVDSAPSAANPELYQRYGATLYFNKNKDPIGIWWPERDRYVPVNDPEFPAACIVFRSTMLVLSTIENHLIRVHWIVANSGTVLSTTKLSPTHPIRRLLKPHIFRTPSVNFLSTTALAPVKGLAYRLTAFNVKGWGDMVLGSMKTFRFESVEEHFQAANLPPECRDSVPFYQDGIAIWDILMKYVSTYIDIFYDSDAALSADVELVEYWNAYLTYFADTKDATIQYAIGALTKGNLAKQITYHIFWVTVGHEFIGDVSEYLQDPKGCPSKIYRDRFEADVQSFLQALVLISLTTGNPCKLMNDWTHIWSDPIFKADVNKHQRILDNLKQFQTSLADFSKVVETRNLTREQQFDAFNPKYASCSVAV